MLKSSIAAIQAASAGGSGLKFFAVAGPDDWNKAWATAPGVGEYIYATYVCLSVCMNECWAFLLNFQLYGTMIRY